MRETAQLVGMLETAQLFHVNASRGHDAVFRAREVRAQGFLGRLTVVLRQLRRGLYGAENARLAPSDDLDIITVTV